MRHTHYVALLRAVNIGGRIVKMTELKTAFEQLGFDSVSTFIASGNVLFRGRGDATRLERKIETHLHATLRYPVPTMLRTAEEIAAITEYVPFAGGVPPTASMYVGFMKARAAPAAVHKALSMQTAIDELHVNGREVYWLARKNFAEATITGAAVEKALQTPVTFRNITTVRRLAAKCAVR